MMEPTDRQVSNEDVASVFLAWPGSSGEAQAKRTAALHLLDRRGLGSLMSNVAHAVRAECGGTLADLGVKGSFKQLLAADPCFVLVDSDRASDQTVQLRRQALAAAAGQRPQQPQQSSQSSSSSSSTRQLMSSGPEADRQGTSAAAAAIKPTERQVSDEDIASVFLAWPGSSGEAQAKRTAALHLLDRRGLGSLMSNVAHAVRAECGGTLADLGVKGSFKQLLAADPCFVLVDSDRASDQTVQLRRQALAAAAGQRPQQPQQSSQSSSSSSSTRQLMSSGPEADRQGTSAAAAAIKPTERQVSDEDIASVFLAWPGSSGEAQAKRTAALHLLDRRGLGSLMSNVAHAVRAECGGTLADLGVKGSFKQLLAADPCFVPVDSDRASDQTVQLRRQALAAAAGQRPQQPQQSSQPRQLVPSGPGSAEQAAIITRVQQTVAEFLWERAGCTAPVEAAASRVLKALGGLKQLGISHKFIVVLKGDPSTFRLSHGPPHPSPLVTLTAEAQQQLQLRDQQPAAAAQSVAALLAHIAGRAWHDSSDSSSQLGVVRKALALAIACVANAGRPGTAPAALRQSRYHMWAPAAGLVIKNALACVCPDEPKSFSKLAHVLGASAPILELKQTGESQHSVVLDIRGLLREAAAAEEAAPADPQSSLANDSASMVPAAAVGEPSPLSFADLPAPPPASATAAPLPPAPAAAAGTAPQLDADAAAAALQDPQLPLSVGALKCHIAHRCWHKTDPQLDLLLWRLALCLVERANRGFPSLPISQQEADYRLPLREADGLLSETCRQEGWHNGSDPTNSISELILTVQAALMAAATNAACFSFGASPLSSAATQQADATVTCVQLNIRTLLRELQQQQVSRVG